MSLKFETFGQRDLEVALDALAGRLGAADLLDSVGVTVAENVRQCFVTGASPYDAKWLPLKFRKGDPLRDTGRLMNSITHRVDGDTVVIGTNVVYARLQNYGSVGGSGNPIQMRLLAGGGGKRGARNIPARPFFPNSAQGLPATWEREINDIAARAIVRRIGHGR